MVKQATLRLSNEADLSAFKQFKETYCDGDTNSQVLIKLLDIGTRYYLGTNLDTTSEKVGTKTDNLVPNLDTILVKVDTMIDTKVDTKLEPLMKFDQNAYEQIKKIYQRLSDLEATVFQNQPEI